jgi:SNF2 family DNA or RNA helicase
MPTVAKIVWPKPLRVYQKETVRFALPRAGCIIADDMGLGKTVSAAVIAELMNPSPRLILVVCPKNAVYTWRNTIAEWLCPTVFSGNGDPTLLGRDWFGRIVQFVHLKAGDTAAQQIMVQAAAGGDLSGRQIWFVMTNAMAVRPHIAQLIEHIQWPLMIVDEAHGITNRKSAIAKLLIKTKKRRFLALTGTPLVKAAADCWVYLRIIDPLRFRSYWGFVDEWFDQEEGYGGHRLIAGVKDAVAFARMLSQYMVRHEKSQVADQLPAKTRQVIWLDMEGQQKALYDKLVRDWILASDRRIFASAPNKLALITRLRQIAICPRILLSDAAHPGATFAAVAETLREIKEARGAAHVLIFTPFAKALVALYNYLTKDHGYAEDSIYTLQGGVDAAFIDRTVSSVKSRGARGMDSILIATTRSAQSYSIETCSEVLHVGVDWTPLYNIQAEDRAHRLTSRSEVHVRIFLNRGTVEEHCLDVVNGKNLDVTAVTDKLTPAGLMQWLAPGTIK